MTEKNTIIKTLEAISRRLEPGLKVRHTWNQAVIDYASRFLDHIEALPAFNNITSDGTALLKADFQDEGRPIEELIKIVEDEVDKPALNPASGGHLGYIPGGGVYPTALGDYLADVTNNYAGIFFAGPGAVRMENMLIRWMCNVVGYPSSALGNLTSGGSIANLIAIVTARDYMNVTPDMISKSCIYITDQAHHSVDKAIRIAGLNHARLRRIPVGRDFKMDMPGLKAQLNEDQKAGYKPFLIIASAGTTDTGVVDPLDEVGELAEKSKCWFHVDAAYGGFFMMVEETRQLFKGIEKSDSITIDPHKGLFLAYGSGAVLIKNVGALHQSHQYQANYMQDAIEDIDEPSPAELSPELTKHFRGMRMWLPLQLYGLAPFKAALREKIWLCRYFYDRIKALGFERGPAPELSVCIYRYVPEHGDTNAFNVKLAEMVRLDGQVFISSTTLDGVYWLRLAVLSFRTHLNTINTCLDVLDSSKRRLLENPKMWI